MHKIFSPKASGIKYQDRARRSQPPPLHFFLLHYILAVLLLKCFSPVPLGCASSGDEFLSCHFNAASLENNEFINEGSFKTGEWILVFIMAKQCPVCDVNLWWWNKLAREFSPRVRIIAVAMSNFPPQEMYKMVVHKQLPYKVFYPVDREKFSQSFRLTFEESRTLLIRGGKIYSSAPGEFGAVDYFKIKKLIKGAENEKNKKNAYRPDRSYTDHGVGGCNP